MHMQLYLLVQRQSIVAINLLYNFIHSVHAIEGKPIINRPTRMQWIIMILRSEGEDTRPAQILRGSSCGSFTFGRHDSTAQLYSCVLRCAADHPRDRAPILTGYRAPITQPLNTVLDLQNSCKAQAQPNHNGTQMQSLFSRFTGDGGS
jgi:hypothetical protein